MLYNSTEFRSQRCSKACLGKRWALFPSKLISPLYPLCVIETLSVSTKKYAAPSLTEGVIPTLISATTQNDPVFSLKCLDRGSGQKYRRYGMAPAQIPVSLSQKPSTDNGQFRVVALRLAWIPQTHCAQNPRIFDLATISDQNTRNPRTFF